MLCTEWVSAQPGDWQARIALPKGLAQATARTIRTDIGDFEVGDRLYPESARIRNRKVDGAASVALGRPTA
ncbi:hypothetical protein ADK67_32905 [Saccharothrix sp. NRRL B-16348]|nr:hypothetical protein ADK67_32905 [Saccharothrix sp. NRRL B-16348]